MKVKVFSSGLKLSILTAIFTISSIGFAQDRFEQRQKLAVSLFSKSTTVKKLLKDQKLGQISSAYLGQICRPLRGCSFRFVVSQQYFKGTTEHVLVAEVTAARTSQIRVLSKDDLTF